MGRGGQPARPARGLHPQPARGGGRGQPGGRAHRAAAAGQPAGVGRAPRHQAGHRRGHGAPGCAPAAGVGWGGVRGAGRKLPVAPAGLPVRCAMRHACPAHACLLRAAPPPSHDSSQSAPTHPASHPGPILAAKDPAVAEGGGSEDAFDLLALAQRLLLDPERAVRPGRCSQWGCRCCRCCLGCGAAAAGRCCELCESRALHPPPPAAGPGIGGGVGGSDRGAAVAAAPARVPGPAAGRADGQLRWWVGWVAGGVSGLARDAGRGWQRPALVPQAQAPAVHLRSAGPANTTPCPRPPLPRASCAPRRRADAGVRRRPAHQGGRLRGRRAPGVVRGGRAAAHAQAGPAPRLQHPSGAPARPACVRAACSRWQRPGLLHRRRQAGGSTCCARRTLAPSPASSALRPPLRSTP